MADRGMPIPFRSCVSTLVVLCALAVLATDVSARQTATIRGFVTDAARGAPLQGASVGLLSGDGETVGTATDADGYFSIARVRAGRYTLRVSFVGFVVVDEAILVSGGEVLVRRVALAESETLIDEVVVVGEREGGAAAVSAGLQSIVPAEIAAVPVPGVTGDVSAYIQSLPGVVAQGDRGGQIFLRGGAVDQSLAQIDGLPVYLPFHVLSFFSAFPLEIVDSVDLYTAGFGARYGGRVSSVLDVHTRNGNKQRLNGSVALAPFLSGAQIEGPLVKDHVSVIGSFRRSLVSELMPNLLGQKFPYTFGDAFGKIHAVAGRGHSLSVTGLTTFDRGDIAGTRKTFEGVVVNEAPTDSNEVTWDNNLFGGTYTYTSGRLPLVLEVSSGYSAMSNAVGPQDNPTRKSEIASVDAALALNYFLRSGEVRVGSRYRSSDLTYALGGQFQDFTTAASTVEEWMSFAEVTLRTGALFVEPSVQLYAAPDYDTVLDPRIRAGWSSSGRRPVSFSAAWGRYHQVIAGLNDERDVGSIFTAWVPALDKLQSAEHLVLGVSAVPTRWIGISVEGYQKRFTDLSVPIFSSFPGFTTALQRADGSARGFDARISIYDYPLDEHWSVGGHVTYAFSVVEYETSSFSYSPPHDRRHQGNLVLQAKRGEYAVSLQSQYGTGLPFNESAGFDKFIVLTPGVDVAEEPGLDRIAYGEPFGGRLPVYSRTDIWFERQIDHRRNRLTVRAGAVNVFNRENLFYFDLFTFRRVDQLPFIPSVGMKLELR